MRRLCLVFMVLLFQAQANAGVEEKTWSHIKSLYRNPGTETTKVAPTPTTVTVDWSSQIISEAFYSLSQSRSGGSSKSYQGWTMGDWSYPWQGDCCDALGTVTRYMYGSSTNNRGALGTWNGFQQVGWCKFSTNLILYRSSYGRSGGHILLPSGYDYATQLWRSAGAGWVIQAYFYDSTSRQNKMHTAIVVQNLGSSGLDVIDSNWVGGNGNFAIARHTLSASTLDAWGFKSYKP